MNTYGTKLPLSGWRTAIVCFAPFAVALAASSALAQSAPAAAPMPTSDEVVRLSNFEVKSTADQGYLAKQTATGLKTGADLMNLPVSVTIIPRELIDDVGEYRAGLAQTMEFVAAGVVNYGDSDAEFMRGLRGPTPGLDGSLEPNAYNDLANIDSVDVLKGPAAVTYVDTSLMGIIVKNSKKPLPVSRQEVSLTAASNFVRGTVDSTGPLIDKDGARITYRVVGVVQRSKGWTAPIDHNDRLGIFPQFQYDYHNLTVRLAYDFQKINVINYAGTFLARGANGLNTEPWSGNGKYNSFRAPWEDDPYSQNKVRLTFLMKLSDNWEMKLYGAYNATYFLYKQSRFVVSPVQSTGIARMMLFEDDEYNKYYYGEFTVNGHFHLLGMNHVSTLGGFINLGATKVLRHQFAFPDVSIYNPAPMAGVPDPTQNGSTLAISGSPSQGYSTYMNAYYMHMVSMWDDRITLVGGAAYAESDTKSFLLVPQTWTVPPQAHAVPHRYGAVVKPIPSLPGIAFFANDSTTFVNQGNRDIHGQLVGVATGEVKEGGVKVDLFKGKLAFMFDRYAFEETNLAVTDPANILYYIGAGKLLDSGREFQAQLMPLPNWYILYSVYGGKPRNLDGSRVSETLDHSMSSMTRYGFSDGALAGLSFGLNWIHVGNNYFAPSTGGGGFPAYDEFNAFINYSKANWTLSLNVKNLANKYYSYGGFDPTQWAWTGEPRHLYVSLKKRF